MPTYEDIYGPSTLPAAGETARPRGASASVEQWRSQLGLDDLELQHHLPKGLMTSVLRQESGGDPRVKSSAGAQGLFQFMPATAAQYKIDPFDPQQAAPAAAKELSTLYKKYGGDIDRTLAAWNWGQGNVDRKGMANMPTETRGFLANVKRFLSPGVAEASTSASRGLTYQDIYGTLPPPGSPAPQPSAGAPTTPAPVSPTAPTPAPAGVAPGGLPAPSPADEQYAAQTVQAMRQRQAQPALQGLAVGGGPTQTPQPVTDPAALLAVGGAGAPRPQTREQQILAAARERQRQQGTPRVPLPPGVPTVEQETLQEGITKPSTMIPLLTGLGTARVALTPLSRLLIEPAMQTVGEVGGRWWETGKTPTPQQALETFAWNLVPSAAEETLRAGGRGVLRRGTGGQMLLKDQAAKDAQGLGVRVMQAPERAALSETFDEIARTGVKLDMAPVRSYWGTLAGSERQRALSEVRRISSPLADVLEKTGGVGLKGWDIGELQHLRSELIKRRQAVTTPETKDLLSDLRDAVDDAIEQGIAVGKVPAGFAPERLKEAQAGWRKMRMAEDLQGLVTKHTSFTPNTQYSDLHLAALNKELQGTTKRSQRLLGQMDEGQREALKAEIKELSRNYPFLKIPSLAHIVTTGGSLTTAGIMAMTGQPGPAVAAAIPAALSLALQSPRAMSLFKEAILRDRGELKANTIALIIDTARRELGYGPQGTPAARAEASPGQESLQAPGGGARTTD